MVERRSSRFYRRGILRSSRGVLAVGRVVFVFVFFILLVVCIVCSCGSLVVGFGGEGRKLVL